MGVPTKTLFFPTENAWMFDACDRRKKMLSAMDFMLSAFALFFVKIQTSEKDGEVSVWPIANDMN